jgi:hypothetical protein
VKRFRKEDGALLPDNPPPLPMETVAELAALEEVTAALANEDCARVDSLPFDAEYEEPEVDLAALLLEDHDTDDEDRVAVVRAPI